MSALKRLWKDTMNIYRWAEYIEKGVTKSREDLLHSNIRCHYSKGSLTDTGDNSVPILKNSHTLFCDVGTDLKEGDRVIVTQRNGRQIELSVGEGFLYTNHMEFSVKRSDEA